MRYKYIILLMCFPFLLEAQSNVDSFLAFVEANSLQLNAEFEQSRVYAIEAKTGNSLPNPEVSYDQLGSGSNGYSEMVVSQSFDFPSLYIHKKSLSKLQVTKGESEYQLQRLNVLTQAALYYVDLISVNRLLLIEKQQDSLMQQLKFNAVKQLEVGDIDVLVANRVFIEAAQSSAEYQLLLSRQTNLLQQITLLSGEMHSLSEIALFPPSLQVHNADSVVSYIITKHPLMLLQKTENRLAEKSIQVSKAANMPGFEVGYRQDAGSGSAVDGIHAGLSIPLFENKNRVRKAKAELVAQNQMHRYSHAKLKSDLHQLVSRLQILQNSIKEMSQIIEKGNTSNLLITSYEAGQINFSQFITAYKSYQQCIRYNENLQKEAMQLQIQLYVLMNL